MKDPWGIACVFYIKYKAPCSIICHIPLSSQETNIPEETLMTVVKPGLPTTADLHVLLPANQPKRKRSVTSDKVTRAMYVWLS